MKKYTAALLMLVLCMIFSSCNFAVSTGADDVAADISAVISDYYHAKDISGSFEAAPLLEEDIALRLGDAAEAKPFIEAKENYTIEVRLIDCKVGDDSDIIHYEFQVLTVFNYVGCDFDTTISDVIEVDYDAERNKIVDMYDPLQVNIAS